MVFRRVTSKKLNFVVVFQYTVNIKCTCPCTSQFPFQLIHFSCQLQYCCFPYQVSANCYQLCFRSRCLVSVFVRLLGGFLSDGSSYTGFLPSSKVGMSTRVLSFPFLKCRLQIHVLAFPGKSFLPMLATHLASSGLFDKGSLKTLNASLYLTYYDIQLPHTHAPSRVNRLNTSNSTAQPLK